MAQDCATPTFRQNLSILRLSNTFMLPCNLQVVNLCVKTTILINHWIFKVVVFVRQSLPIVRNVLCYQWGFVWSGRLTRPLWSGWWVGMSPRLVTSPFDWQSLSFLHWFQTRRLCRCRRRARYGRRRKRREEEDRGNALSFCCEFSPIMVLKSDEFVYTLDSARGSVLMLGFFVCGSATGFQNGPGGFRDCVCSGGSIS